MDVVLGRSIGDLLGEPPPKKNIEREIYIYIYIYIYMY